jgi:hypothetical protein
MIDWPFKELPEGSISRKLAVPRGLFLRTTKVESPLRADE